jgi:flagellar biosynthesis protein FlhB
MAENSSQERTEAATPRRREEARDQGQVAHSTDVSSAILLTAGGGLLWWYSPILADSLLRYFRAELGGAYREDWSIAQTVLLAQWLMGHMLELLFPLMIILFFLSILTTGMQVGLRISWEPLSPDWSKLSLTNGWSKLFSLKAFVRGGMLLLKLSLGILVAASFLRANRIWLFGITQQSLQGTVLETWSASLMLMLVLGGALLALGGFDFFYQRWQHEESIKMSRQDIRDEHKHTEGDPQIKARMKRMQRDMLKLQMLRKVQTATVVLTNPTHLAVAILYDRATMTAPRVIAKGEGAFAKRIARVAREHGVPVLERKPLARALYASVRVDQEIPPNLYRAIAEILAHIYKLGRAAG